MYECECFISFCTLARVYVSRFSKCSCPLVNVSLLFLFLKSARARSILISLCTLARVYVPQFAFVYACECFVAVLI